MFPKSLLIALHVPQSSSITVKRDTKLLTFGQRTMLVIKLSLILEQAASQRTLLYFSLSAESITNNAIQP